MINIFPLNNQPTSRSKPPRAQTHSPKYPPTIYAILKQHRQQDCQTRHPVFRRNVCPIIQGIASTEPRARHPQTRRRMVRAM